MIVIDKAKLKFLLAGRVVTVQARHRDQPYKRNKTYALGVRHNRTICRVQILHVEPGGKTDRLEIRQAREDKPRLLAARSQHGYTTDPTLALVEEPEAVEEHVQRRFSKDAFERDDAARREAAREANAEARRAVGRLKQTVSSDRDLARSVAAAERMLKALERKLEAA